MTPLELAPTAKPLREQAADWLVRKSADNWDAQLQRQLDAWLAASEYHRAAYWRLEAAWNEAIRLAALRHTPRRGAALRRILTPRALKAAAAGVLLSIAGAGTYQYLSTPSVQIFATPVGGHRTLTLPDGTIIELNTDTVVSLASNLSKREASLIRGEAYFEIAHDARHPFIVTIGEHRVTDLGTKFLINRTSKTLKVALFEGRARLDAGGSDAVQRSTELSPGEIATLTQDSMSVTTQPSQKLSNELSWREGLLIFDGTSLVDAVSDFNRYNVEKIVVRDPSVMRMRINGTFPVHSRQEFVDVAKAVFGLRVSLEGNNTLISR